MCRHVHTNENQKKNGRQASNMRQPTQNHERTSLLFDWNVFMNWFSNWTNRNSNVTSKKAKFQDNANVMNFNSGWYGWWKAEAILFFWKLFFEKKCGQTLIVNDPSAWAEQVLVTCTHTQAHTRIERAIATGVDWRAMTAKRPIEVSFGGQQRLSKCWFRCRFAYLVPTGNMAY